MELDKKTKIIITLASTVIFINFIVVIIYFLLSTKPAEKADLSSLTPAQIEQITKEQIEIQKTEISPADDFQLKLVAIGFIIFVVISILILGWYLFKEEGKIRKRDIKRKADLYALADGFLHYFKDVGKFPQTSEFGAVVPAGIKIPSEWNFYGFPANEVMKRYVLGWPIFDPLINPADSNQFNQYVYFLRQEGNAFDLYAHLENEKDPQAKNYNVSDKVPLEFGDYNFKVSSSIQLRETQPQKPLSILAT